MGCEEVDVGNDWTKAGDAWMLIGDERHVSAELEKGKSSGHRVVFRLATVAVEAPFAW